jgi:hypothetical protein
MGSRSRYHDRHAGELISSLSSRAVAVDSQGDLLYLFDGLGGTAPAQKPQFLRFERVSCFEEFLQLIDRSCRQAPYRAARRQPWAPPIKIDERLTPLNVRIERYPNDRGAPRAGPGCGLTGRPHIPLLCSHCAQPDSRAILTATIGRPERTARRSVGSPR